MRILFFLISFFSILTLNAQRDVIVKDYAKVGFISTGSNANINITQIIGKSPEYAEITKYLNEINGAIEKKSEKCGKYSDAVANEDCRAELISLNHELDSMLVIEARFKQDVLQLAENFSKMEFKNERLKKAKSLFDEGKISEAYTILNFTEMEIEGDALLADNSRILARLERNDSLLHIKADEFAFKAQLKAIDYKDVLRYDSADMYFQQSLRYNENVDNLWNFAVLLVNDNQVNRALGYYEKALKLARSESEEATIANNLGIAYTLVHRVAEAEEVFLYSFEIRKKLSLQDTIQFQADLAATAMNLGVYYSNNLCNVEAESMYLIALTAYEKMTKINPAQYEPDLAKTAMNLGVLYKSIQRMGEAEAMYLRSFEIYERLAKIDSIKFDPALSFTAMNFAVYYQAVNKMEKAEKLFLFAHKIFERLTITNQARFEPFLARSAANLGRFYAVRRNFVEAEKMHSLALTLFEKLAKSNPLQFEPDLAKSAMNYGVFLKKIKKWPQAESMYLRTLEIDERLIKSNPTEFEPSLAYVLECLGNYYDESQNVKKAEEMFLRALEIYQRLSQKDAAQFEDDMARIEMNLGNYYLTNNKIPEAEKCYQVSLEIRERLFKRNPAQFQEDLAFTLGNMSSLYILTNKASMGVDAAEEALSILPSENWIRCSLGHCYLFNGDWPKAKVIYIEYLKNESDPVMAKANILKDLDELATKGITAKEMKSAQEWLKE